MTVDEDNPPMGSVMTQDIGSHILIAFKLRIAKEEYDGLSDEARKLVNAHCEEDAKKLYKMILKTSTNLNITPTKL